MECYCEPNSSDDYADAWITTWRKAKKPHVCCECLETISPGEKYERIFSLYEGCVTIYKTCEFCAKEYEKFLDRFPQLMLMKGDGELACRLVWEMRLIEEKANVPSTADKR